MDKKVSRLRRARRTRAKIKQLAAIRLSVYKSLNNTYAQLLSPCGSKVLACASTVEKEIRDQITHGGNKKAAAIVGEMIAKRGVEAGIKKVAFDRAGFPYHGRVEELVKAAREGGLEI